MNFEALNVRVGELIDRDELSVALGLVDNQTDRQELDDGLAALKLDLLLLFNEFEVARQLIISRAEAKFSPELAQQWTALLYRMDCYRECLDFVRALPPDIRRMESINIYAWYAASQHKSGSLEPPWLEGAKPESLRIGDLLKAGRDQEAESLAAASETAGNEEFEAALSLAYEAMTLRDLERFNRYIQVAKSYGVQRHQTLQLEAEIYAWEKSYAEATRCLDELQEILPRNYFALKLRARIDAACGRKRPAIVALEQALSVNPIGEEAFRTLLASYLKAGQLRQAASVFSRFTQSLGVYHRDARVILDRAMVLAPT